MNTDKHVREREPIFQSRAGVEPSNLDHRHLELLSVLIRGSKFLLGSPLSKAGREANGIPNTIALGDMGSAAG
jgi:hypothetical protein